MPAGSVTPLGASQDVADTRLSVVSHYPVCGKLVEAATCWDRALSYAVTLGRILPYDVPVSGLLAKRPRDSVSRGQTARAGGSFTRPRPSQPGRRLRGVTGTATPKWSFDAQFDRQPSTPATPWQIGALRAMKPRFLPKFPIFVQDWLGSMRVRRMTLEERGAYLEACLFQWQEDGLPANPAEFYRTLGISGEHPLLIEAFPVCGDGLRRNAKVAAIRAEAEAFCDERSASGRKGNAARWVRDRSAIAKPVAQGSPPTPTPTQNSDSELPSAPSERATDKPSRSSKPRKPPSGPHADCIRTWETEWSRTRLGQPWAWQPKDAALMAKALKLASGDPEEVQARTTRLLESGDAWLAANASPGILVSRWNQLAVSVERTGTTNLLDKLLAETEHAL